MRLLIALALLAFWLGGSLLSAATYYVRTDGNDSNSGTGSTTSTAWATIQHAANQSLSPGDEVYIKAGTYNEQVTPNVDGTSGSPIRFIGDRSGTVSGWSAGNVVLQAPTGRRALYINTDDYLEFSGFHFVGSNLQAVLVYPSTGIRLESCDITSGAQGIYCYNTSVTLVNLLVHDCASIAVYSYGTSTTDIWNCTIANNSHDGLRTNNTSVATMTNCIVANNGAVGIRHINGTTNHSYNVIYGNAADYSGTSAGTGEISSDPLFVTSSNYRLQSGSPAVDAGTNAGGIVDTDFDSVARPFNGSWDMGCFEKSSDFTAYYVRPDGDNSNDGTGPSAADAWASVAFAATQSLSPGDIVYVQAGTYYGTVFVGVDGTNTGPIQFIADLTGAVSGWTAGKVTLQATAGGKVLDIDSDDYVEFEGFNLEGDGGDDAVDIDAGQGVVVRRCEISGGVKGIEVDAGARATIVNCLVRDNTSKGINVKDGYAEIWHCTVVGNQSDGIEVDDGGAVVANCIVVNNGDAGIDHNAGKIEHTYNLLFGNAINYEGTSAATGEITLDPEFEGAADYHLAYGSPAIDAGTSSSSITSVDLEGRSRPNSGGYDMGCYEAPTFYFVRTDGDDANTGTGPDASSAWATIDHAAETVSAGSTVYVQAGTYNEIVSPTVDGTEGSPIRFIGDRNGAVDGWGGGSVTIQAPAGDRAMFLNRNDYLEFSGFHIYTEDIQAIYLYICKGVRLDRCDITNTTTHAIYIYNTTATLTNLLVHDGGGMGLYVFGNSDIHMYHCTIANNANDGMRAVNTAKVNLQNSIVAFNGRFGLYQSTGVITSDNNIVHGNTTNNYVTTVPGAGDLNVDPEFVCDDVYYLSDTSPAIDAGINLSGFVENDLDANPRPIGTGWDMGCFEGSGLLGHWKLDETSGTLTADSSGYAWHGTYGGGPVLGEKSSSSSLGTAVEFDGTNDHVDLPQGELSFANGFSVSVWVKPTDTPAPGEFVGFLGLGNGVGVDEVWFGWVGGAVGLQLYLTDTIDGNALRTIEDNTSFSEGKWVYCVATVDAAGNATLYRNGDVTKTGFNTSLPKSILRTANTIATSPSNDYFPGLLDDVRIYNRPLCAEEVDAAYQSGRAKGVRIIKWVEVK